MALTADDVRHVAELARLALTDEEVEALAPELSAILAYAEKVQEVARHDVPPTGHAYPLRNVLAADEPRPSLPPQVALSTAPRAVDGRFQVPRIVAEEG